MSAVVGRADVLGVLTPGTHGSTFGGIPLACAVGPAVAALLEPGDLQERAVVLGEQMHERLDVLVSEGLLASVRTVGLWAGVDVPPGRSHPAHADQRDDAGHPGVGASRGRELCEEMARRGVLAKETHGATIRLAPPLTIRTGDLHHGLDVLGDALRALA